MAGLLGGFVGNGIMGSVFSLPLINTILYNPAIQSQLFIEVTPARDIPLSVTGLIVLSVIHAYFFSIFEPSIPGMTWQKKGCFGDSQFGQCFGYFKNGSFTTHY